MRKIIAGCVVLLAIGNEVTSIVALCVLCSIGVAKLLTVAAKGGAFD